MLLELAVPVPLERAKGLRVRPVRVGVTGVPLLVPQAVTDSPPEALKLLSTDLRKPGRPRLLPVRI